MIERIDSRHWSQRWLRCAQSGHDAVVMYDLYQPLEIHGCGRGRCTDLTGEAADHGHRFRVTRFWDMETCPHCGRPFGYARNDQTLYLGDSEAEALSAYEAAELSFFGYEESA
jgi:hypothetical protein